MTLAFSQLQGYAYVLGELESLMTIVADRRAAEAARVASELAEAERLEAERMLTTLAEPLAESIAEVGAE